MDLLKKRLLITGALIAVVLLGLGALFAASTWGDVNRVTIDRPPTASPIDSPESEVDPGAPDLNVTVPPAGGDGLDVLLLVGSDSRDHLADTEGFGDFAGQRADVVMVLIRPRDGDRSAAVLSLPRDLWVKDSCNGPDHRLNDALEGCGALMNGPTALIVTVEDLIGLSVDHFALVDLAGFQEAVDAIGGYEICLQRSVRDEKAQLHLPAGCTRASGAETLAWLRSRSTQELTADGWEVMPGVSDLTRNQRQREFLLSMLGSLGDFSSPQDVASVAQTVAPYVTVDSDLSILDAVSLAWTMRGLGQGSVEQLEIPVRGTTTAAGADVLLPSVDISEMVASYLAPEVAQDSASGFAG